MARGFGATLGAGASDVITPGALGYNTLYSIAIRAYRNGAGGSNTGRIWDHLTSGTLVSSLLNLEASAVMQFGAPFSGGTGTWTFPRPSAGGWADFLITHDATSAANTPVAYLTGVAQTVTNTAAPSGAFDTTATATPKLGNRGDADRVWDGMLADYAVWTRILTPDEATALASGLSPDALANGLVEHVPMLRSAWARRGVTTISGTAVQPHPRTIFPRSRRPVTDPTVTSAAGTFQAAWAARSTVTLQPGRAG